ncbi:MAG: gliding motility lipoprotein GldD [Bacteroidota bacterium]|nr:gliding motility lipoprotein GldD [Bacteroidota bacterium]
MRNYICVIFIVLFGCENYFLPKQSAYLRLDYPKPEYKLINDKDFPFFFEANTRLSEISDIDINLRSIDFIINYNQLNAQINFQYKNVNSSEKLKAYILDLKSTIETHSMMANSVKIKDYSLKEKNIFGRIFDLSGNVASPYQFYLTDSINNIISGLVYFNIKPNYDSILPAINYIENDIIHLIESFDWKNYNK